MPGVAERSSCMTCQSEASRRAGASCMSGAKLYLILDGAYQWMCEKISQPSIGRLRRITQLATHKYVSHLRGTHLSKKARSILSIRVSRQQP